MAENVGGIFYTVDMDASRLIQQQQRVNGSLDRMDGGFRKVDTAAGRLTAKLTPLAIAIGALITIDSLRRMQQMAEQTTLLQSRISRLSDDAKAAGENYWALLQIANTTGSVLGDTIGLWESLTASLREMGATNPQILMLTETLQKIGTVGGSSAAEMSAALRQFGQFIAGGVLRAEEFNSIVEQMPELARTIARGLGIPFNELRQQMLDGELTADRVLRALEKEASNVNIEFEKMPRTTEQAANAIRTSFAAALSELDKAARISETLAHWMDVIAESIVKFTRYSTGNFTDQERYNLLLQERRDLLSVVNNTQGIGTRQREIAAQKLIKVEEELLGLQEKFKQQTIDSSKPLKIEVTNPEGTDPEDKDGPIKRQNEALREQKRLQDELDRARAQAGTFASSIVGRGMSQEERFDEEFEQLKQLRQKDLINAQQYESAKNALSVQFAQLRQEQLRAIDPMYEADAGLQDRLTKLQTLHDAELIEEQRYLQLKNEMLMEHELEKQRMAEETFRKQSELNEFMFNSLDALGQSGANAIAGLMTGTMSAQDALRSLASTILNEAVSALVQIGIQHVKNQMIEKAAAASSVVTATATGGAIAAAYAPAAAAASVATLGTAATVGLTAMAAAIPAMIGLVAGGRQYGGPVAAGSMYRINENGAPEIYQAANGQQYMLPNSRGEVISNRDATSGGGAQVSVIVNNNAGADIQTTSSDDGRTIEIAVNRAVNEVAGQINGNRGPVWSSMRNSTNITGRTR